MKLLIIDDEKAIINRIVSHLFHENWTIDFSTSYDSAHKTLKLNKYDIVICDFHLWSSSSNKSGLALVKNIRADWINTPVILLTWKEFDEITPWDALEAGFDDFIKKPYEPRELKARISALLRREVLKWKNVSNFIKFKNLEISLSKRKLILNWNDVKLWNTLFLILFQIIKNKGKIVTYEQLTEYIWWEPALYVSQYNKTIRVHMSHLREILWEDFSSSIRTVHGVWYVLDGDNKMWK